MLIDHSAHFRGQFHGRTSLSPGSVRRAWMLAGGALAQRHVPGTDHREDLRVASQEFRRPDPDDFPHRLVVPRHELAAQGWYRDEWCLGFLDELAKFFHHGRLRHCGGHEAMVRLLPGSRPVSVMGFYHTFDLCQALKFLQSDVPGANKQELLGVAGQKIVGPRLGYRRHGHAVTLDELTTQGGDVHHWPKRFDDPHELGHHESLILPPRGCGARRRPALLCLQCHGSSFRRKRKYGRMPFHENRSWMTCGLLESSPVVGELELGLHLLDAERTTSATNDVLHC
mmetsp:Transcript_30519/g.78994  ORF Transcript_30519/g.78994 Transcript_30519/m.78994 type:complete len:284 (-) Transcript_30519:129-980(-)